MSISKMKPIRDILLAFARVHVLHHAAEERIFGLGMKEELARHGYQLGPGTLYPLLQRLHADGLLSADTEVVDGKRRKYYAITARGRTALRSLRPKLAELAGEVLPDATRPPAGDRRRRLAGR
jgi:DNA-binding PadR family transcriptional regulator